MLSLTCLSGRMYQHREPPAAESAELRHFLDTLSQTPCAFYSPRLTDCNATYLNLETSKSERNQMPTWNMVCLGTLHLYVDIRKSST